MGLSSMIVTQSLSKSGSIIRVDVSVGGCARDGNVSEAGVEQVRVDDGIDSHAGETHGG